MSRSFYTKLVANLLFPLHEWLKQHHTVKDFKRLEQSQWLNSNEIDQLQAQKLRDFIHNIYHHVAYYRNLFDSLDLKPSDIQTKSDLAKLPLLTKELIRNNFDELSADDAGPLRRFNTGGSSGQPLVFLLGKERVSHDVAAKWRATRWWNVDIGDKEVVVWGSPIELNKQDRIKIWRDKLFRSKLISAFDLTEEKILSFIEQINSKKPSMLFGYPSVFFLVAKIAKQHQIRLDQIGIKVVFVTSERLYPYQRELIEEVFSAPVANGYGGRDAGFIAHQCPAGSLHISAEDIIVEIIDREGKILPPDQTGEIVVTHLATGEFPFLRYKTGDVGALSSSKCSCGRQLPILINLEGRTTDFVVASDGTIMHGLALIYILREYPEISDFKINQESKKKTTIHIVTTPEFNNDILPIISDKFKQRLGNDVNIEFEFTDKIMPELSGKFRYVVSKVNI
jgi:phenylacetate-CoA ligase